MLFSHSSRIDSVPEVHLLGSLKKYDGSLVSLIESPVQILPMIELIELSRVRLILLINFLITQKASTLLTAMERDRNRCVSDNFLDPTLPRTFSIICILGLRVSFAKSDRNYSGLENSTSALATYLRFGENSTHWGAVSPLSFVPHVQEWEETQRIRGELSSDSFCRAEAISLFHSRTSTRLNLAA